MNNLNLLSNEILKDMMSDFEIKKATELFSSVDTFLNKYKDCFSFLDNDDEFVSFLEYLEIEEHLRSGYLL